MWTLRSSPLKRTVGAASILGALLNAWVLTVHVTSVALSSLYANGDRIVVCHQGGLKYVDLSTTPEEKPAPKRSCPICSGLAALHIGILSEPQSLVQPALLGSSEDHHPLPEILVDHRPWTISNRGPPLPI